MKWFYHQRVSNTFQTEDLQTLDSWGWGRMGRLTHSPSPSRQHLPWPGFQLVSGLVQTKTFGLLPDSEFIASEPLPLYRSPAKTHSRSAGIKWGPQGVCVSRGLMTWAG